MPTTIKLSRDKAMEVESSDNDDIGSACPTVYGSLHETPVGLQHTSCALPEHFTSTFVPVIYRYPDGMTGNDIIDTIAAAVVAPVAEVVSEPHVQIKPTYEMQQLKAHIQSGDLRAFDRHMQQDRYILFSVDFNRNKDYLSVGEVSHLLQFAEKQRHVAWEAMVAAAAGEQAADGRPSVVHDPVDPSRAVRPDERRLIMAYIERFELVKRLARMLLYATCRYGSLQQIEEAINVFQCIYGPSYLSHARWRKVIYLLDQNDTLHIDPQHYRDAYDILMELDEQANAQRA